MQTTERINRIKNWIIDYCKSMPTEAKTLVIEIVIFYLLVKKRPPVSWRSLYKIYFTSNNFFV